MRSLTTWEYVESDNMLCLCRQELEAAAEGKDMFAEDW